MPSSSSDYTLQDSAGATRRSDSADNDLHTTLPAPDSVLREGSRSDIQLCWDLLNGNAPNVNVHMGTPVFGVSTGSEEDESTEASEIALPRFVPKQTMGVGAFGVVISVYDQHLQRPAAMKILRPSRGTSSQMIARFLREARTVAPMEHPGIVRVYETGVIGGLPFIAVELVEGPDLAKYLRSRSDRMSVRQAVCLMLKVTAAVQFAHSRGVLHRDLKPSNILLAPCDAGTSEGLELTPRLTDFGLAKLISPDQAGLTVDPSQENLTGNAKVLGTVRYMSPEQASGRLDELGTASDVFSLGVILYELLTGKLPFNAASDHAVMHQICNAIPDRPRKLVPGLSRDLEAIVLKALEKKPEHRYADARQLHEDLHRYFNREPVSALKYSYLRHFAFQVRRHPVVTAAIAIAVGSVLSAAVLVTVAWWNERKALARELAANQREATVRRQREVAQNQTLAALNDIFFTLAEQLNNGDPITPDERIELLQQSLKFHREFVNEAPMDRQKRHRLSIAYHHLANALTNVGRNDESLEARLQTVRLLDELLQEKPSNKLLFQKGVAFFNLSDLYAMRHDRDKQTDYALKAAEVLRQVIAVEPENTDYREVLIGIQAKLFAVESDPLRQEQKMRDVVKASTALWESAPQQPRYAKFGVFASVELASLLCERGRGDEAYEQLKATERLYDRAFDSVRTQDWAESIARVMVRRGEWLLMQLGKWQEVCEFARRGEELEQPSDLTESTGIVCAYKIFHCHALAIALKQLGDVQAAEKALKQAAMYEKDLPYDKAFFKGLMESVEKLKIPQDAGQQSTQP